MELAEDRYALLSDIISRVFQRWLIQNCKRCERFASVNREFSQFSTSSAANSLPLYGTLLRLDKSTLGSVKTVYVFWNFSSIEIGLQIWWAKYLRKKTSYFTANSWLPSFVIKEPFRQLTFLRLSAKFFGCFTANGEAYCGPLTLTAMKGKNTANQIILLPWHVPFLLWNTVNPKSIYLLSGKNG